MLPAMIVSPHLDDAVLSVGQVMAGRPNMTVVTVFAGIPQHRDKVRPFDVHCGFDNAAQAVTARRAEDRAACRLLNALPLWLDFADGQYDEPADPTTIEDKLVAAAAVVSPTLLIGPLGLVHPDHHTTRVAFEALVAATGIEAWIYEDLPSRVLYPEAVPDALDWWKDAGYKPELDFVGTGPLDLKDDALGCYSSQHWWMTEHWHSCLVRERLWRLWP